MADIRALIDRVHYDSRRKYTDRRGNIKYLDGKSLTRPSVMPRTQRIIAIVFVVAAILIGVFFINRIVVSYWQNAITTEKTIESNLAREASIVTVPNVAMYMPMDNATILATFDSLGFKYYQIPTPDNPDDLALFKLPSDVSVESAATMYLQGIGSLDAEQASLLLNGSWYFGAERVNGTSMIVRYADFKNGDPQIAVQDAIMNQGFDTSKISESGVDDSGNTFSTGIVDIEGKTCTWKVSAIELSDMYSIQGLPEKACYVGIRITSAT